METYVVEVQGDVLVLRADGGLNTSTAGQLSESIAALLKGGITNVVVDCSKLAIISSMGLGALLMLHTRMRRIGGEVRLAGLTGAVVQVIQMTKLDRVFEVYRDVEQAKASFRKRTGS
ncbi:MAG: anti-sigma factor antagonist [Phycisphaerales bacterium]|nr:anti-sigma factor antagonist [Phycisphaerales bacterium]